MKTVGLFEAKNHLSALIDEVERGETVMLTRHGQPVAQIVPVAVDDEEAEAAMKWLLSRRWKLGGESLRELVNKGRRF